MGRERKTKKAPKVVKQPEAVKEPEINKKTVEKEMNAMMADLSSKLLTKTQLRVGGRAARQRNLQEQGYLGIVDEINVLRKQLGFPPTGLGHLRKN